jgi:hypothetical protein
MSADRTMSCCGPSWTRACPPADWWWSRGGSSTCKTGAAYEAVAARLAGWQLDYPMDPAALAERLEAGIPARTVLWLGELRQYADADADADGGADVLGRLADLIVGEGRLLITTVWPEQWTIYTAAARAGPGAADPAGVAGRLLTRLPELTGHDPTRIDPARGGVIDVPARFTAAEMTSAAPPVTQRWRLRPWRPPAPSRTGKSPSTWPGSLTCWTAMPGAAVTRTARRSSPRRWSERPQPAWRAIRKPTTA